MNRAQAAIAYLRVSGKGQIDGDGFTRQRTAIEKYATKAAISIVQEFRDEGVSGKKDMEHREGLAALFDYAEANKIQLVLVERADRLARDLLVGEIILNQFRSLGVTVVEAESGTDLTVNDDDPTRKLIRQVLGAVAEFEKSVIVAKLRAARDRIRHRQGRCEGRKPYGTWSGEHEIASRIRELRRKRIGGRRMTFRAVAESLNNAGITTRYGCSWRPASVHAVLKSKQCGGKYSYC